MYDIGKKIILN